MIDRTKSDVERLTEAVEMLAMAILMRGFASSDDVELAKLAADRLKAIKDHTP